MARNIDPIADMNECGPIIPHEEVAGGNCCGCLVVRRRGDQAEIICNECATVIRTVTFVDVERAVQELAPTDTVCSACCWHCGAVKVFPGVSTLAALVCHECGDGVVVTTGIHRGGRIAGTRSSGSVGHRANYAVAGRVRTPCRDSRNTRLKIVNTGSFRLPKLSRTIRLPATIIAARNSAFVRSRSVMIK
jgi:hypothetical protein